MKSDYVPRCWRAIAACLVSLNAAAAEPVSVGAVDKVQEQVVATQAGATRDLAGRGPGLFSRPDEDRRRRAA